MATGLYAKGREGFLGALIDFDSDTIKVFLVDSADYTVNLATHDFLDDVSGAGIVGTPTAITSPTITDGVADAADTTLATVSGDQSEAIIMYKHTGTDSTSRLIAYIDSYTGLPVTPNGGNITIAWPNDSNKIFKL